MRELIFNDVLEPIEIQRSDDIVDDLVVGIVEFMAGFEVEFMFDHVPILESKIDVVVDPLAFFIVFGLSYMGCHVCWILVEVIQNLHNGLVVVSSQD